jgi:hypothetical protein
VVRLVQLLVTHRGVLYMLLRMIMYAVLVVLRFQFTIIVLIFFRLLLIFVVLIQLV